MRDGHVRHPHPVSLSLCLYIKYPFFRSFWYFQRHGVPFSSLAAKFGNYPDATADLLPNAQSVYFFTLIVMQWGCVPGDYLIY